ncbi:unnamed protein product, partial [Effrenium voratum]
DKDAKGKAKVGGAGEKPILAAKIQEVKGTYGKMSAKARGARIHPGPLQLRKALAPRDTTEWVRAIKQPYSYFESAANEPSPLPEKSKGPPALWLPVSKGKALQDQKLKDNVTGEGDKGKEKDKKLTLADYDERTLGRPPWDEEHHIMVSRMNGEMQSGAREYFDKPKRKEGEGIPKTREQYVMNDRQAGWNDEPGRPGEMRKTLFNNVGSFNIGGCKDHQLPSYWRKIKDWGSLSSPAMPTIDLRCKTQPHGQPPLGHDKRTFFQALANTPGREATAFWRSWADLSSKKPEASPKRSRWNNSWQESWAQANEDMNWRCREYFSVPLGGTGRSMPSSSPSMQKHPLALTFQDALRAVHQDAKA